VTKPRTHRKELNQKKKKKALSVRFKRFWKAWGPRLVNGSILIIIVIVVLIYFNRPSVEISFKNYSGLNGHGTIWEANIDVIGGRPLGIRNLFLEFRFPANITKIEKMSDVSCEGLRFQKDLLTEPKGFDFKATSEKSGRIFADKCPDGSKTIFRFETQETAIDDLPVHDEGYFEGKYDWPLPIIGWIIPWSAIDKKSVLKGVIPASQEETPAIITMGYPASVSGPPYYNLKAHTGSITSILDPRDFNDRLNKDSTLSFFSRPSTKVRTYTKKNNTVGIYINWLHCEKPITVEKVLPPIEKEVLQNFLNDKVYAGISFTWKDCMADINIIPVKK